MGSAVPAVPAAESSESVAAVAAFAAAETEAAKTAAATFNHYRLHFRRNIPFPLLICAYARPFFHIENLVAGKQGFGQTLCSNPTVAIRRTVIWVCFSTGFDPDEAAAAAGFPLAAAVLTEGI